MRIILSAKGVRDSFIGTPFLWTAPERLVAPGPWTDGCSVPRWCRMENVFPLQPQPKRTDMSDIKSRVIAIIVDKLGVDQGEVTP
jgi:hypothetical protein